MRAQRSVVVDSLAALVMSGGRQNFLGAQWVASLLRAIPASARPRVALRLLSLSPHYFYDRSLDSEAERNRLSRNSIVADIVAQYMDAASTVIDYGCGPGFMAAASARLARRVVAVDISPGVLECARTLNGARNIEYLTPDQLSHLEIDADLAYSFAVAQHLYGSTLDATLSSLRACMRPGGWLMLHFALPGIYRSEREWLEDRTPRGRVRLRLGLNCFGRTADEMMERAAWAGFGDLAVTPIAGLTNVDDDIRDQHLLLGRAI